MIASAAILETKGVGLDYGRFTAVGAVDLSLAPNRLHTVIGPNGAGKTTLFNLISGRLSATRGTIRFVDADITTLAPRMRARLGLARSYQITSLFPASTVRENLQMAVLGQSPADAIRFWDRWTRRASQLDVSQTLDELDLRRHADAPVGQLAHGVQRVVEIAMCLAAKPRLLLLDEPLAGLGLADVPRVSALLESLKRRYTILLVEHNMRVVMSISDRITVMFQGNVIAEGEPEAIRQDPEVRRVYLGSHAP